MKDKRDAIISAARKRFRHYGIKKTTMGEIARDADVAVGTLYLYFKDKDDLIYACSEGYIDEHRQVAETLIASGRPAGEILRDYLLDRFRKSEAVRTGFPHAAELAREVLRVRPDRLIDEGRMMREYFGRILEDGVKRGEFFVENVDRDSLVLLLSVGYSFSNALSVRAEPPREEDLLLVLDWFLAVWKRRPTPSPDVR